MSQCDSFKDSLKVREDDEDSDSWFGTTKVIDTEEEDVMPWQDSSFIAPAQAKTRRRHVSLSEIQKRFDARPSVNESLWLGWCLDNDLWNHRLSHQIICIYSQNDKPRSKPISIISLKSSGQSVLHVPEVISWSWLHWAPKDTVHCDGRSRWDKAVPVAGLASLGSSLGFIAVRLGDQGNNIQ